MTAKDMNARFAGILLCLLLAAPVSRTATPPVETKIVASDGASQDYFGDSVALDGDTLVVGASLKDIGHSDAGAVYVFVRTSSGWVQQQELISTDPSDGYLFGSAVAVSGDTLVIGCPFTYLNGVGIGGAAYVYTRNGGVWTVQQRLAGASAYDGDAFGYAIGMSAGTIVVGAYGDLQNGLPSGAAYVFVRQGSVWSLQQTLVPNDALVTGAFGTAAVIAGNTAVIGALGDGLSPGSAYVFTRSGTAWQQVQKLVASDGTIDDGFGLTVGLTSDTLVVGAPRNSATTGTERGAAYIFGHAPGYWTQLQRLEDTGGEEMDQFGHSVAISGDRLVVGSVAANTAAADTGAADVYFRAAGVWSIDQRLAPVNLLTHDVFGHSVAVNTNLVAVGALQYFNFNPGAAYVYKFEGTADTEPPTIKSVTVDPDYLFPANHKLVPITIAVVASDNVEVASSRIISVTCNESAVGDWQVTGDLALNLRADRNSDADRVYTVTVECLDAAHNSSTATVAVTVPKHRPDAAANTTTGAAVSGVNNRARSLLKALSRLLN